MRASPIRDLLVGLFVLAGLGSLAYLSFTLGGANYGGPGGLPLYATFDQIAGLKARAPVEISGVRVGAVTGIQLDEFHRARVDFEIDARLQLPIDTSASIVTAGLLGDRYIALEPGAEDRVLEPGEEIGYTESALVLERLIGRFLYSMEDNE